MHNTILNVAVSLLGGYGNSLLNSLTAPKTNFKMHLLHLYVCLGSCKESFKGVKTIFAVTSLKIESVVLGKLCTSPAAATTI